MNGVEEVPVAMEGGMPFKFWVSGIECGMYRGSDEEDRPMS